MNGNTTNPLPPIKSSNKLYIRTQNFILVAAIAYMIFYLGIFTVPSLRVLGSISKIIMAICLWCSILTLPWRQKRDSIFQKKHTLIILLLILGILSIIHTIISDNIWLDKIGNRYLTLFGNPDTALMMMAPVYFFFPEMFNKRFLNILTYLIIFSLPILFQSYIPLVTFIIPFFFVKRYYKNILLIAIIEGILFAFEGARIYAIFSLLFVISYYSLHNKINKKYLYYISASMIISISCLFYNTMMSDYSVFDYLSNINSIDNTDTRTFLYRELYEDLSQTKTLLLGKGAYSLYFSEYFYNLNSGDGDFYMRIGAEVGILAYLQKAGLAYVVLLILIYLSSIQNALMYSKSKYMKTIGVILALWLIILFISSLMGHQIIDVFLWCLIGMCHSKNFLQMTNKKWEILYKYNFRKYVNTPHYEKISNSRY